MPNPYREIFKVPGAKGFAAAGFIARLPIAMAPIGIVAMLSQTHGEYWLAGAVSATFALYQCLCGATDIAAGRQTRSNRSVGAHQHRFGSRLPHAHPGRQSRLACLDDVLFGLTRCDNAEHTRHGSRTLERDFPRPARA